MDGCFPHTLCTSSQRDVLYIYIYSAEEVETSPHILYERGALDSLRQTYLDSFFLDLEDI